MREKHYDCVAVGARIKRAREINGFTQEYVSKEIGVNSKHISNVERGEARISIEALIKLCDLFNVTADYILFNNDNTSFVSPIHGIIENLDEKDRVFIEDFICFYLGRGK